MSELRANPQLEDGYVRIANELIEEIARYPFRGAELRILIIIIRLTYGWRIKENVISFSKLSYLTALDERHVKRIVRRLAQDKVLIKYKIQRNNVLGLNKDYYSWRLWKSKNAGD